MNLKKLTFMLIMAVSCFILAGCGTDVEQGQEGTFVKKPIFFGNEGVEETPASTGYAWHVVTTSVVITSLQPYMVTETFDDLVTNDNNPVDFKVHMTFQNIKGKTPVLVELFGANWYGNNLREPLRNMTRQFTRAKKMFDMTTSPEVTASMQKSLFDKVTAFLKEKGIPVQLTQLSVGKVFPPQAIVDATIETGVQKQRVKTQNERKSAEDARMEAETAAATADKAYASQFGMTPDQYLHFKMLENQRIAIEGAKEGKITLHMLMGGDAKPMYSVK